MGFDKTFFPYFNKFCVNKFGSDIGKAVNIEAENKLSHMIKEADYRNNKYIRWHMDANMLPSIAIYLAFKKFPGTADKAYEYTDEATSFKHGITVTSQRCMRLGRYGNPGNVICHSPFRGYIWRFIII